MMASKSSKSSSTSGRKTIKQACDGCKIRKIKCSELPPCGGCAAAGIPCTFKRVPSIRGPRNLRPKTIQQITARQRQISTADSPVAADDSVGRGSPKEAALSTPSTENAAPGTCVNHVDNVDNDSSRKSSSDCNSRTSVASLVFRLCIYRLRLFPVWPIVAVEDLVASLQRDEGDEEAYALANAIGAATVAQLRLDSTDSATGASMETECQLARSSKRDGQHTSLDALRAAFFLHIYHENQVAGGVKSLLYLREAISLAQILGLHRESTYASLTTAEQEIRRRILWLLFVTERGVAMLYKLPVILKPNTRMPSIDSDDGSHILPAFQKLVNLFWIFDQSGAFETLQNDGDFSLMGTNLLHQNSLGILQQRLEDVSIDWESSNDIQRADICVTRQWMRAVLWRASLNCSSAGQIPSFSHPFQIAKEFLAVISKLPTAAIEAHGHGIEFKVFEIASAVTDAMANSSRGWSSSENAREILGQLHRILSSSRGGNMTLASMLCFKIAQIQDQQPLLLDASPRIRELYDLWPDQMNTSASLDFELNGFDQSVPSRTPPSLEEECNEASSVSSRAFDGLDFEFGETRQPLLSGQELPWASGTEVENASATTNSLTLYERLQDFDGSFGSFQAFNNNADRPMFDNEVSQRIAGDVFTSTLPLDTVFSQ